MNQPFPETHFTIPIEGIRRELAFCFLIAIPDFFMRWLNIIRNMLLMSALILLAYSIFKITPLDIANSIAAKELLSASLLCYCASMAMFITISPYLNPIFVKLLIWLDDGLLALILPLLLAQQVVLSLNTESYDKLSEFFTIVSLLMLLSFLCSVSFVGQTYKFIKVKNVGYEEGFFRLLMLVVWAGFLAFGLKLIMLI